MPEILCPYLGSRIDPDTAFSYATPENLCFRAEPVSSIELSHQERFCLDKTYTHCPIFLFYKRDAAEGIARTPTGITQPDLPARYFKYQKPLMVILAILALFVVFFLGWNAYMQRAPGRQTEQAVIANAKTQLALTGLVGVEMTLTPGVAVSNQSPVKRTVTPVKKPARLNSPTVCVPPPGWVQITLQPGDTLSSLSETYQTSTDLLRQANCLGQVDTLVDKASFYVQAQNPTYTAMPTSPIATSTNTPISTPE